jgi:hypothetical protein
MSGRGKIVQAIGLALICAGPVLAIWSLLADWIDPSLPARLFSPRTEFLYPALLVVFSTVPGILLWGLGASLIERVTPPPEGS